MSRAAPILVTILVLGAGLTLAPTASAAHTYSQLTVRSFDGTYLAATIFTPAVASPANPVPWILMTHGWAGERVSEPTGRVLDLLNAGYGVLTWDSRGFGASGGEVMLNSPDHEVRDVSALIDILVGSSVTKMDRPGDPRIGMVGGSYAGGIQLLAAAHDPRIDVIAPENTWNDLNEALAPNGVPKIYWTSLLFGGGLEASCVNARNGDPQGALTRAATPVMEASTGCQTSDLARWYATVHATGAVPDDVRDELARRSPATYMEDIRIPTLLLQGYPDTLFDVGQALANYEGIKANGAPVKLWLHDGGHSRPEMASLVPNTQGHLVMPLVVRWMDRHLKGISSVDTGPKVEYFVEGEWRQAPTFPLPDEDASQELRVAGLPAIVQAPATAGPPSTVTLTLTQGPAVVAGTGSLSFYANGFGTEATIFASLAVQNGSTTTRLGDQVQPIRFGFDLETGIVETDLIPVATRLDENERLVLALTSSDPLYHGPRTAGFVNLEEIVVRWQLDG